MGRSYYFECPKCSYRAAVAGRADGGVSFAVQTIVCRECKELHDAVVGLKTEEEAPLDKWRNVASARRSKATSRRWGGDAAPSFQAALSRLPLRGNRRFRWVAFKARCPVSPLHRVQIWNDPGKCPKCGAYLEKSALPYRIWD